MVGGGRMMMGFGLGQNWTGEGWTRTVSGGVGEQCKGERDGWMGGWHRA